MSTAKKQARREVTENQILDAFETVLLKSGVRGLTMSAIAEEADVGKPLLYRYFGDLSGLVRAWGERRSDYTVIFPRKGFDQNDYADIKDILKDDFKDMANVLRLRPAMLEFLAEELVGRNEISSAFNDVRKLVRKSSLKRLMSDSAYLEEDNRGLILILFAAITYMALRSRSAPQYFDLDLSTDEGWAKVIEMIEVIIENSKTAATVRSSTRER